MTSKLCATFVSTFIPVKHYIIFINLKNATKNSTESS